MDSFTAQSLYHQGNIILYLLKRVSECGCSKELVTNIPTTKLEDEEFGTAWTYSTQE
jgi:hypothetical protein